EQSGKNTLDLMPTIVKECGYKYSISSDSDTISKILRDLGFHELVVLVVESGIESGKLAEALTIASDEVNRLLRQGTSLAKSSRVGVFYHLVGILMLIGTPYMCQSIVIPMVEAGRLSLDGTPAFLMALMRFNNTYGFWMIPALAIVFVYFRHDIFKTVKNIPVLGLPYLWLQNRRAIQFNLALDILLSSGYPTKAVPQKMLELCPQRERCIYQNMIDAIEAGQTVSEQITKDKWPRLYSIVLSGFENNVLKGAKKIK
ncbi:MAG: hypothetical protein CSA19_01925, partial [Deltaproteobacteria bacterium]